VNFSEQSQILERVLWLLLGILLYTTFTQIPLGHLRDAFSDIRFIESVDVIS